MLKRGKEITEKRNVIFLDKRKKKRSLLIKKEAQITLRTSYDPSRFDMVKASNTEIALFPLACTNVTDQYANLKIFKKSTK